MGGCDWADDRVRRCVQQLVDAAGTAAVSTILGSWTTSLVEATARANEAQTTMEVAAYGPASFWAQALKMVREKKPHYIDRIAAEFGVGEGGEGEGDGEGDGGEGAPARKKARVCR